MSHILRIAAASKEQAVVNSIHSETVSREQVRTYSFIYLIIVFNLLCNNEIISSLKDNSEF